MHPPPRTVLTLNAGSSSLKASLFTVGETEERNGSANFDQLDDPARIDDAVRDALTSLVGGRDRMPDVVAHRIVHGGPHHMEPERITGGLIAALEDLLPLNPDHLPQALAVIRTTTEQYPSVPQVACFDTAFHRTLPRLAQLYPLPRHLRDLGLRRYGFHGLSCELIVGELGKMAPVAPERVIIAHLGNGASMTAVRAGRSIETTMGFSPTGGLVMGTRSGDLDPSVLVYAQRTLEMTTDAMGDLVNRESGLIALSETTHDMRSLLAREPDDPRAADAIGLFCYSARKALGGLIAVLGGLDVLVFTGGIGEHAPAVRARICDSLGCFGIELDADLNAGNAALISRNPAVQVRVIPADEERMLARHACRFLRTEGVTHV